MMATYQVDVLRQTVVFSEFPLGKRAIAAVYDT